MADCRSAFGGCLGTPAEGGARRGGGERLAADRGRRCAGRLGHPPACAVAVATDRNRVAAAGNSGVTDRDGVGARCHGELAACEALRPAGGRTVADGGGHRAAGGALPAKRTGTGSRGRALSAQCDGRIARCICGAAQCERIDAIGDGQIADGDGVQVAGGRVLADRSRSNTLRYREMAKRGRALSGRFGAPAKAGGTGTVGNRLTADDGGRCARGTGGAPGRTIAVAADRYRIAVIGACGVADRDGVHARRVRRFTDCDRLRARRRCDMSDGGRHRARRAAAPAERGRAGGVGEAFAADRNGRGRGGTSGGGTCIIAADRYRVSTGGGGRGADCRRAIGCTRRCRRSALCRVGASTVGALLRCGGRRQAHRGDAGADQQGQPRGKCRIHHDLPLDSNGWH